MPEGLALRCFKAALFDVDGTLVDSLPALVGGLGDTFERFAGQRPSDDDIRALIGLPLRTQLRMMGLPEPEPAQLQTMVDFAIDRFEANKHLERPIEGAIATLRLCRRLGIRTALVTSKNERELAGFLPRFAAADAVDTTVSASDVAHPKPDPESARLACARLGVAPEEALMIGDSIYDLRCARDAGVTPIAVAFGAAPRSALEAERPAALFETPEALLQWAESTALVTPCPERK